MKRLKIVMLFLLIFASLPLSNASAASDQLIYYFVGAQNIDQIVIEGTGTVRSINRSNTQQYDLYSTIYNNTNGTALPYTMSITQNGYGLYGFIINGTNLTNVIFKYQGNVVNPPLKPGTTPTPTATATPTPTATATLTPTATPVPTTTPEPSPSATPTPTPSATPDQTGDRAILTVTLINGIEKEYDLSMNEVDAFLNWYDARDAGRGTALYAIDKHTNNKGPFGKRKDYVIFDKILTFEVSEYTTE